VESVLRVPSAALRRQAVDPEPVLRRAPRRPGRAL